MIRFISIVSILIIGVFLFSRFDFSSVWTESPLIGVSFEEYIVEAIERNTPEEELFSFSISLAELFWRESMIFQNNHQQILLRNQLQENFNMIVSGQKQTFSLQRTQAEIDQELIQRQRQIFPNNRNIQNWFIWAWWNISQWEGECSGLFFNPCITIFEPTPPPWIMQFWTEKWNTSL